MFKALSGLIFSWRIHIFSFYLNHQIAEMTVKKEISRSSAEKNDGKKGTGDQIQGRKTTAKYTIEYRSIQKLVSAILFFNHYSRSFMHINRFKPYFYKV